MTEEEIPDTETPDGEVPSSEIQVDFDTNLGEIMNLSAYNGSSTTSAIPAVASETWLKQFDTKTTRVWVQLRFVYNNGNINYNYKYSGSNVPVEEALAFYSKTSDSLLVALSGHTSSSSYNMPEGDDYVNLVKETVLHYKRKFPKIKYIQVSNEPDLNKETMVTYYPVYKYYYKGLNSANAILKKEAEDAGKNYSPILISNGAFTSNVPNMLDYAETFLDAYVADSDITKRLDFFSFNNYAEADRPKEVLTAKERIDNLMQSKGLPKIPVFISEFGAVGGSSLPSGLTLAETVTLWPASQLTKAYYFYEGGIDAMFNWVISHSSLVQKSQLLDLENATASPYGNMLVLSKMFADYGTRIKAESDLINDKGLGVHVLAAKKMDKGMTVLVWNYNWRYQKADQDVTVTIKNIPVSQFGENLNAKVYMIDSKNNNYYINKSQTSLETSFELSKKKASFMQIPLKLERSSVALIVINK
ncbi:hypothetical protein [Formosa haliotis]|uniref:hypothetical protein n=1 Tax=Formosa haliotis TaxID=1555194 RepID=UPI001146658A|nr:hypothetical protein [Formosa haliotis]